MKPSWIDDGEHMYQLLAQGGAILAKNAPEIARTVKDKMPAVWDEATKKWASMTNGKLDLMAQAKQTARNGDKVSASALLEVFVKSGAPLERLQQVVPLLTPEHWAALTQNIVVAEAKDVVASDSNVASNGLGPEALAAKAVELRRVRKIMAPLGITGAQGVTIDEIAALIVFFNTTTTEQLRAIQANAEMFHGLER